MRLPFREIATALQATSRNDIKCFARNGISDVTYATLSVIEQSNAATNPYFAISKAKTALEMVVFIKLSKGHSCHIITSAIIKNKCIKVR